MRAGSEPTGEPEAPVRAVLFAHPAGHSLSPVMHDAAFDAAGIEGRYRSWDVAPAALADAVARLRSDGRLLGANVTVPHKEAVLRHCDRLAPGAARVGAVNTLLKRSGTLIGDNTDVAGFAAALAEAELDAAGARVVVLGAGGAARAVVAALLAAGAQVQVFNRDQARGARLVRRWRGAGVVESLAMHELAGAVARCRLLVNATSVGMQGGPEGSPLPPGLLPRQGAVVDLVYRPRRTPLLSAAAAAGLQVLDGLPMLLHQGARSFEAWTGLAAPLTAMRAALESALDP